MGGFEFNCDTIGQIASSRGAGLAMTVLSIGMGYNW